MISKTQKRKAMKKIYLFGIMLLMSTACLAQYNKSAGLRLGNTSGVTFKKFVHAEEALEILLSGRNRGLQFTGQYLFHQPLKLNFSDRIYLIYGVGGHFGYEKRNRNQLIFDTSQNINAFGTRGRSQFTMGVDASIGLEYRWLIVPMTIGFDLKPYFDFVGMQSTDLRFWDSAISFKYIF